MDILKVTGKKGIYNQVHRRAIVAACKLVGRQVPKSLLSMIPQVAADANNTNEGEELLQIAPDGVTRTRCTGTSVRTVRIEDDPIHTIHIT